MTKQSWKGSALLNPVPPVLVSCGSLEKPNLITVGWAGTVCTRPPMVSISLRPERYSYGLIKESGLFAVNLPTEALVRAVYSVRWFRVTPLTVMPTSPVKVTMLDFRPFSTS